MPFVSVPNAGQSLGATRDQIRNNILDIKNSLAVNHVDLDNAPNTGKHIMTNFVQISLAAQKPTTSATEVALYNDVATTGQIYICPPNTTQGDKKKLLTAGDISLATFGTNTNYPTIVAGQDGGWTFLPGGLLLQYGKMTTNATTGVVQFPISFSSIPYSINITPFYTTVGPGISTYSVKLDLTTAANLQWSRFGVAFEGFFWQAIGPA